MKKLLLLLTFLIPLVTFGQEEVTNEYFSCAPQKVLYDGADEKEVISAITLLKERLNIPEEGLSANVTGTPKIIPVVFNMLQFSEDQYSNPAQVQAVAQSYVDLMNDFFANGGDNENGTYGQSNANMYFVLANLAVDCQSSFNGVRIFDFADYAADLGFPGWTGEALNIYSVNSQAFADEFGYHPDKYLNFYWLDTYISGGLLGGWSFIPTVSNPAHRGVYMHDHYWEHPDINKPVQILAHEVGHFLGLPHTFAGHPNCASAQNEGDCETEGDGICDTPPTIKIWNCDQPCDGITADLANFMSYTRGDCGYFGFTDGQINQMHAIAEELKPLIVQQGIDCYGGSGGPGCTDNTACNFNPFASSDDGSCTFFDAAFQCGGDCTVNVDGDYICDDIDNCTDINACNYDDSANEPCAQIDACGICGGPGNVGYDCYCRNLVPPECSCTGGVDFNGDGICDDNQIYDPPPPGTPQVVLGDCPDPVDLVFSLDFSGSITSDTDQLTIEQATRAVLNFFYPAIISGDMRVGLSAWSNGPITTGHTLTELLTGQAGWSVINGALDYYSENSPDLGGQNTGGTEARRALQSPYAVLTDPTYFLGNTQKAMMIITDGEYNNASSGNSIWQEALATSNAIQGGTYDLVTALAGVESTPNIISKITGIVILNEQNNDQNNIDWTAELCQDGTDVYPAANIESLLALFDNLSNSICTPPAICTGFELTSNNFTLNNDGYLGILLPELETTGTSEDIQYEIYQEWTPLGFTEPSNTWALNYNVGQTRIINGIELTEHLISIDEINANINGVDTYEFKVVLNVGESVCEAEYDLSCSGSLNLRNIDEIWPQLPGAYVQTGLGQEIKASTRINSAGYYDATINSIRLPYFPNGRYWVAEANKNNNGEIYQYAMSSCGCAFATGVEIDETDITPRNLGIALDPDHVSFPQSSSSADHFYSNSYDGYGKEVTYTLEDISVAEIDLTSYINQFDIQQEDLKVIVSPFGQLFTHDYWPENPAPTGEVLNESKRCAGFELLIPSCQTLEDNLIIAYNYQTAEYSLFYRGPSLVGNSGGIDDIFSENWGISIGVEVNGTPYTLQNETQWTGNQIPPSYDVFDWEDGGRGYDIQGLFSALEANPNQNYTAILSFPNGCSIEIPINEEEYNPCVGVAAPNFNGYTYSIVAIGNNCWFAENLKSGNLAGVPYSAGDNLWQLSTNPRTTAPSAWTGGEDRYSNGWSTGSLSGHSGRLFNWYATQEPICPEGWHVSTNADWNDLEKALFGARYNKLNGQSNSIGGDTAISVLINAGFLNLDPIELEYPSGTDTYNGQLDFSPGLHSGVRVGVDAVMRENRTAAYWWTFDEYPAGPFEFNRQEAAWARGIKIMPDESLQDPVGQPWLESDDGLGRYRDLWSSSYNKSNGLGCRCVKDVE